jgi:hypothetical protein
MTFIQTLFLLAGTVAFWGLVIIVAYSYKRKKNRKRSVVFPDHHLFI